MAMSRDRVRFKIDPAAMSSEARRAFMRAFGTSVPSGHFSSCVDGGKVTVICRPSQFARFLIFRNDEGGRNGFKELEPQLFIPEESRVVDVSKNPRDGD
jgi:hypothetical protein